MFCFCAKEFRADKARLPAESLLGGIPSAYFIGFLFLTPITTTLDGGSLRHRVTHIVHCSPTWIQRANARVGKRVKLRDVITSQLMTPLRNVAMLWKRKIFRTLTLNGVIMISQDLRGGAEMREWKALPRPSSTETAPGCSCLCDLAAAALQTNLNKSPALAS